MGDIPGTYDKLRERRERSIRYFGICLLIIVIGLLSILAVPRWQIVLILLLAPTFVGGYAVGSYMRNLSVEILSDKGYEHEDADLWSLVGGIFGGIFGTISLAGMQLLFVMLLISMGSLKF
ncbi:MAG TPA: hypothetical protein PK961_09375 [bacterium]|nr:hypothetical protein [bacterium]